MALFPLYLLRDLGLSTATLGLVYSASSVGGLAGVVAVAGLAAAALPVLASPLLRMRDLPLA